MAAPTTSANFSWLLPTEGASSGVWDTFLNDVVSGTTANSDPFDGIDKVVGDIKTTADAALARAGGSMSGDLWFVPPSRASDAAPRRGRRDGQRRPHRVDCRRWGACSQR